MRGLELKNFMSRMGLADFRIKTKGHLVPRIYAVHIIISYTFTLGVFVDRRFTN